MKSINMDYLRLLLHKNVPGPFRLFIHDPQRRLLMDESLISSEDFPAEAKRYKVLIDLSDRTDTWPLKNYSLYDYIITFSPIMKQERKIRKQKLHSKEST